MRKVSRGNPSRGSLKVSVIITCYNKERYISRAINSCINQNFPEDQYEIIVVDDASTDSSKDAISLYRGFSGYNFIRMKFLKQNKGPAHASNVGIDMARGRYIVRVDADDYVHRDFLKTLSETLEWNPDIGFVHCDLIVVTGTGAENERHMERNTQSRLLNHGAGVMFRTAYLKKIGKYDESLRNCEDYDLLLRYRRAYNGYHLRLPYYRYFKQEGGLSGRTAERARIQKLLRKKYGVKNGYEA